MEAAAMHMNAAFDLRTKQQCPQAEMRYEPFHVVECYRCEVINRISVDQTNLQRDIREPLGSTDGLSRLPGQLFDVHGLDN
ncbi:hypothetical protein [Ectopseudomonas guguanensis]